MTLLIAEDVNLSRIIFVVVKTSKFLHVYWNSLPFPRFPIKV